MIGVARLIGASSCVPLRIVAPVGEHQRLLGVHVEEVEADAGDVRDQQIDRVEHPEDVPLHEDLVLERVVVDRLVGGVQRLSDACVCRLHVRVLRCLDTRVRLVDDACARKGQGGFDDGGAVEIHRRVVVRVVLTFPMSGRT